MLPVVIDSNSYNTSNQHNTETSDVAQGELVGSTDNTVNFTSDIQQNVKQLQTVLNIMEQQATMREKEADAAQIVLQHSIVAVEKIQAAHKSNNSEIDKPSNDMDTRDNSLLLNAKVKLNEAANNATKLKNAALAAREAAVAASQLVSSKQKEANALIVGAGNCENTSEEDPIQMKKANLPKSYYNVYCNCNSSDEKTGHTESCLVHIMKKGITIRIIESRLGNSMADALAKFLQAICSSM